jgi:large subunit ribosomal protein L30
MKKIAIIQIRGTVNTHPDVRKTLELLRLKQKHACVVVDDTAVNMGMIKRVKDYVTYGNIDESLYKTMLDKRGELLGKEKLSESKKVDSSKIAKEFFESKLKLRDFEEKYQVKPFFRLHPPAGGFERKGIKMPYAKGGVLGDRKEDIKDLIEKML